MDGPRSGSWMDDTGAGGQPSRAEFEALRRKVEAIDDLRRKIDSMDELAKTSSIASPRRTSIADEGGGLFDSMRDLSPKTTKRLEKACSTSSLVPTSPRMTLPSSRSSTTPRRRPK